MRHRLARATLVVIVASATACSAPRVTPPPSRPAGGGEVTVASWYGDSLDGRRTASGERFDANEFTAAHRSLPLGTRVRVTNLANGRSVVVRINDRGPFVRGRAMDVSYGAARALGMQGCGTGRVHVEVLGAAPAGGGSSDGRQRTRHRRSTSALRHRSAPPAARVIVE